ncbi:MAG: hypothetical protein EBQ75_04475 [Actinobacteria bacterium]|nr:hypothetical protein [Actinomycetota bacterium]
MFRNLDGFLLAGGGALLATGLTTRPTNDLDFFGSSQLAPLREVVDGFIAHSERRGWSVTEIQFSDSFARLVVTDDESLVVDIAIDSPAIAPVHLSTAGPTFALDELAGRKLLALFDRAEARDFADIYALQTKFDKSTLLARASDGRRFRCSHVRHDDSHHSSLCARGLPPRRGRISRTGSLLLHVGG